MIELLIGMTFIIGWKIVGIAGSYSMSPEVSMRSDAPKIIPFSQIAAMQTVNGVFLLNLCLLLPKIERSHKGILG